ncbi:hypothetical protein P3T27_002140 [Kitasatospora sp. MAA19]|nr:hypothetical protein [Kitasatospora sp. MAA19]
MSQDIRTHDYVIVYGSDGLIKGAGKVSGGPQAGLFSVWFNGRLIWAPAECVEVYPMNGLYREMGLGK